MVERKGNIIRGVKKSGGSSNKRRCPLGVNKKSGKCLKHPRRKN